MHSWPEIELDKLCRDITVGFVGTMANEYVNDGVLFLRSQNILPYTLNLEPTQVKYISRDFNLKIAKSKLYPGDIAIVRTGYPGTACVIPEGLEEVNCSDLVIVRPEKTKVDSNYLCYYINSPVGRGAIFGSLVGVAQQHFNVGVAKRMKLKLPPLRIQTQIASLLTAYDELIRNNKQRIKLLEEMSEEIYKEWFVRLRFPGYESTRFLNERGKEVPPGTLGALPEGWEKKGIFDLSNVTYGFPFNSVEFTEQEIGFPIIRIRDIRNNFSKTYSSQEADEKYLVENGDLLVGMDGDFHVGIWAGNRAYLNQRVVRFRPKDNIAKYFMFWSFKKEVDFLDKVISGTTVAHLGDRDLKKISIVTPDDDLMSMFKQTTESLFELKVLLTIENQVLQQSRNLLLPRLISGKLTVKHLVAQELEQLPAVAEAVTTDNEKD